MEKNQEELLRLEKEMQEAARNMQIYKREGNDLLYASEWSNYTKIIEQIQQIKNQEKAEKSQEEKLEVVKENQEKVANQEEITELEKEMQEAAKNMRIYKEEGNEALYASEWSKYTKLVEQIQKMKNQGEIAKLEDELKKTAERIKEYKEAGAYENEAYERSEFAKLAEKIQILKGEKTVVINPKKEVVKENVNPVEKFKIVYRAGNNVYTFSGVKDGKPFGNLVHAEQGLFKRFGRKKNLIKAIGQKSFNELFSGVTAKAYKKCDINIVKIILENAGVEACKQYLIEVTQGIKSKSEIAPQITYDLSDLKVSVDNKTKEKLGLFARLRIASVAKQHAGIATIIPQSSLAEIKAARRTLALKQQEEKQNLERRYKEESEKREIQRAAQRTAQRAAQNSKNIPGTTRMSMNHISVSYNESQEKKTPERER